METVTDVDWSRYLDLWDRYENAVAISIAVWNSGGGCMISNAPTKLARDQCTGEQIDRLQHSIDVVKRIAALGVLIMAT